ncbi:MAG TPA: NADH-quinone oxidoreductase subunit A [Burkholderiales bacterium]|nr:NADH-quinone oxidoreductase subunit A [Burkholderiales bacterium]
MEAYGYLFLFLLATAGVVGLTLALNALLGPRVAATPAKLEPFECGAEPIQQRNVRRLSVKYYPIAIFFLLFDLETVLLFIWAGSFGESDLATVSLLSFLFFMVVLALALAYLWREGALEWR